MRDEAAVHRVDEPSGEGYWLVTRYAEARAALADGRLAWAAPPPAGVATDGLRERVDALLDELAAAGGGDLIGDFARRLGTDTVGVNVVGNGMVTLFRHAAQRAALRARPDLLPGAIEELVRYDGPVARTPPARAREALTIGGTAIPAGGSVVVGLAAADRDRRRFSDPDRLDLTRGDDGHLGFGHGLYRLPSAAAARVVGRVAIGALLERFPRLAPAVALDDLEWVKSFSERGVGALPVKTG
ncbi:hypothetical protein [Actinoplanes sp. NPDC049265]|uniref:hypothetical protein n=1 Tax=Actinoplanes sp. NPDC049265 TaxID=3363902 RepID=UPI00371930FE